MICFNQKFLLNRNFLTFCVEVRIESAEVRLSHLEYRIACLKAATGLPAYNTAMEWQMSRPTMIPPSMPQLPLPPSIAEWQSQWQCPGQIMGVAVSNTEPFSSHEQQHSRMPAQQQGPLLHVPTADQNCNYLPTSEVPSHQLRNIDDVIAQNR